MNKFTDLLKFLQQLFDDVDTASKAKRIVEGILKVQSPRLSDIARKMSGREEANYKSVQRFIANTTTSLVAVVSGKCCLCDRRSN